MEIDTVGGQPICKPIANSARTLETNSDCLAPPPGSSWSGLRDRTPHEELGPLFTIAKEELNRPARRREDRDVLVLRVEIGAQRREVARLMHAVCESAPTPGSRVVPTNFLERQRARRPTSAQCPRPAQAARGQRRHALPMDQGRCVPSADTPGFVGSLARHVRPRTRTEAARRDRVRGVNYFCRSTTTISAGEE